MLPRSTSAEKVCATVVAALLLLLSAHVTSAQTTTPATVKLAFFNIKSGKGQIALPGFPATFADTNNCTDRTQPLNAWGVGAVQAELTTKIANDPSVISLGLAEAWPCATPSAVRAALGWKANSTERNGVAIVARYGFAGPEQWTQLDTGLNLNPADTMWVLRIPVCVDAACSASVVVFTTHWYASGATDATIEAIFETQAQQTISFMNLVPGVGPQVLLGDLNLFAGAQVVCEQAPRNTPQRMLADAGYLDAWISLNGLADGFTGMWNRPSCGAPTGNLYKRIDYSWSRGMSPLSMTRFGMVVPGYEAPSDHAGIIVEYPSPRTLATSVAPAVAIRTPSAGATVRGQVTIAVDARDDEFVSRVELMLDGQPLAVVPAAPFEYLWSTTRVPNGTHTLTAAATDNAGNRTISARQAVNVQNTATNGPTREIVLYASRAATLAGNWIVTPDASAAGGARLQNPNLGAAKIATPLAAPASYFELTFNADAGIPYRLWLRGKAQNDDYANDSVAVQFDHSVDAFGAATARIGTAAAETVVLENCSGCGLSGWGWQDNAYGVGALGPAIYFSQSGSQRVRIQVREDGVGLDQIVLSAGNYLTTAPGATKNDTTILPPTTTLGGTTAIDEIVLYAAQAPLIAGAWSITLDATAASGARLQNPNMGAAKITQALANPASYFDLTFDADAGKPYRLWLRGKAQNDDYLNDSVFVQFDRSVDASGAAVSRIGTASGEAVIIENCGGCGLNGWGWQDNAYGQDALGPTIYFSESGTQRLRIQVREDGVGIDQVVLSAVRYLTVPPGATKADATILQR
jgi:Bacterial Ig domain